MSKTSAEYRNAAWYDVIVHADHADIRYRRRYKFYSNAFEHLTKVAGQYRTGNWTVTRVWENGHVHLLERRGDAPMVLWIVGSIEWQRDWLPFIERSEALMAPVLAKRCRGRSKRTLRRWAREARKMAGINQ